MMLSIISVAMLAAAPLPQCRETTRHADGTTSVRDIPDEGQGAMSSTRSSNGSAHSAVSASSASSTGGTSRSSASSNGRRVEVERDAAGCRIIITEQGEE